MDSALPTKKPLDSRNRRAMWPSLPHEVILNNLGCLMARREPGHDERTRLAAGNLRPRDREIACWDYPARWWRTVDARCPPPSKGRQNECTPARGRDLRSTGTTRCRTVYGVILEWFFACRSQPRGSVHAGRRAVGRDSFIRAFALEGNKAPHDHGQLVSNAEPEADSRKIILPLRADLAELLEHEQPPPNGGGRCSTRAWPNGQAPAFQAGYSGSTPDVRSSFCAARTKLGFIRVDRFLGVSGLYIRRRKFSSIPM